MKDLDFDELDRAVNSLITSTPGSGSDSLIPTTPVSPVALDQPLSIEYNPSTSNSVQSIPSSLPTVPIVAPVPVVERPSTGRFMDVVRPSSDMRSSLMMPERSSNQVMSTPFTGTPMIPETPALPVEIKEPIASNQSNSAWPDPIDFDSTKKSPEDKPEEEDDIDRISNDIANTLGQKPFESMDSPFLSDAKVEKRPLGAFSDDQTPAQPVQPIATPPSNVPLDRPNEAITPNDRPIETDTPLPAELQDDLLSIESDSTTTQPEKPVVVNNPIITNQSPVVNPTVIPTTPVSMPAPTAMPTATSITQQYKEQPSTGEQKNGAIYDTNAYNKPMATPKKKKAGLMWAIWIAIFLVIGAAAGAAVYFFVLPRL